MVLLLEEKVQIFLNFHKPIVLNLILPFFLKFHNTRQHWLSRHEEGYFAFN